MYCISDLFKKDILLKLQFYWQFKYKNIKLRDTPTSSSYFYNFIDIWLTAADWVL